MGVSDDFVCRGDDWAFPGLPSGLWPFPWGQQWFLLRARRFFLHQIRLGYRHSLNELHEYLSFQWLSWSCTYRFPVHLYIFYACFTFCCFRCSSLIVGPSTWFSQGCKFRAGSTCAITGNLHLILIPSGNVGTLQGRPINHIGFAPVSEEDSTYIHCIIGKRLHIISTVDIN